MENTVVVTLTLTLDSLLTNAEIKEQILPKMKEEFEGLVAGPMAEEFGIYEAHVEVS
jgi:hypothetical protein